MSKFTYPPGHKPAVEALLDQGQRELRDRFAMAALMGELAAETPNSFWPPDRYPELARCCYAIADAMMEARQGNAHG